YNIDPVSILAHITPRTKAVVAVDFTEQAVGLDEIRAVCRKHDLILIEDAAHSIGTRYKGQPVGSLADMTAFSFHPVKTVTAGEGGAVTTNSKELYDKLVLLHAHGITRDRGQMVHPTDDPWYNEQAAYGFNYRMTEIQAALLMSQLNKLDRFSQRRREIVKKYDAAFSRIPQLQVQQEIPASETTRHLYILRLRSEMLSCTRREFFDAMGAEGIHSQVHYMPVYWHSYYESLGYEKGLCPQAERYYQEVMSLPLYYSLTDQDVEDVIHIVSKLVEYYKK
ncbi:MAG: DegT/DnrJ/EryC1/StrS family aminotransferase, partial [Acetatifactor sp.]|nr:DegT/DnrJ/EryC1/StrS family aminotransferase [Acetatifactor sp.]